MATQETRDPILFSNEELERYHSSRPGETRLGERVQVPSPDKDWRENIASSDATQVIIGIPEDIGPRGNLGKGGAHKAWEAFLPKFLNVQSNQFLHGNEILILGRIPTEDLMKAAAGVDASTEKGILTIREFVSELDQRVYPVIKEIVQNGKEAVVIGGGHNNSYPNLRGASEGLRETGNLKKGDGIGCINMDPHADMRRTEGRHSGNGFTYAFEEGYLSKYSILGLHKNYNSEGILKTLTEDPDHFHFTPFDTILDDGQAFREALESSQRFIGEMPRGIELDLDSIRGMAVSAETPSGFSEEQARRYIMEMARSGHTPYFHFAEGAPENKPGYKDHVGKFLAYLVTDVIRTRKNILS